jgi:hypothetical protein
MHGFITILTAVFTATSVSVAQSPGPAQVAVSKRLQLTVKAPEQKIARGTDIEISLTLRNTSSTVLGITDTSPDQDFNFIVKTSDDREVRLADFGERLATEPRFGDLRVTKELKPGENFDYAISLGMLYRLERPGRYFVRASRVVVIQAPDTTLERVISNPITVMLE